MWRAGDLHTLFALNFGMYFQMAIDQPYCLTIDVCSQTIVSYFGANKLLDSSHRQLVHIFCSGPKKMAFGANEILSTAKCDS